MIRRIERRGRASRVDELIFKQVADRFELAVELEIPAELCDTRLQLEKIRRKVN